jgi:cation transport ATPase
MTQRHVYRVHGLHCAEEIRTLRHVLEPAPGIKDLGFDLIAERMYVDIDPAVASDARVRELVSGVGMKAEPWHDDIGADEHGQWPRWLGLASGASLVVALAAQAWHAGSIVETVLAHDSHDEMPAHVIALFVLAAAAGVAAILPKVWRSILGRRLDMHVLVVVSIVGASALGEWSEGATVASLFAVANLLESWSVSRARREVAALMRTAPRHAHVVADGREHCVPAAHVAQGSTVIVRPGERIPASGVIRAGASTVIDTHGDHDHRHTCGVGDSVSAGWQNGDGELEVDVTARPPESAVARMVEILEHSRARRAGAERWVEQFALYYTPVVLGIALLVILVPPLVFGGSWHDWFYRGLVVTLIACPCALVISTPVTIVAALASAARRGVLVKGGEFLETAAQATHVALDVSSVAARAGAPALEAFTSTAARLGVRVFTMEGPGHAHQVAGVPSESFASGDARVDFLTGLRRRGMVVVAVGDGRGDAGVLGASSLGMVMGAHGTESAIETADVVSVSDDIRVVPWFLAHARHTVQVVKQNVAIAIGAKVLFLAAAGMGSATLWMAVAADTGATIAVTFNALRMLRGTRVAGMSPLPGLDQRPH